jgi:hypothetical protein
VRPWGDFVTVLAFGNRLSATAWAREVVRIELNPQNVGSSGQANDIESVEFDLSDTRSADFLILGRLLILLELLVTRGARLVIRMPSKDLLETERIYLDHYGESDAAIREAALRQISRHQRQRINCRLFIRQSGFDSALHTGPLKQSGIDVVEENDSTSRQGQIPSPGIEPDQYDIPRPPQRQRGIIPYRWVNAKKFADHPRLTNPLLRSIRGLGLAADDATALTRGVLDELIENTKCHGQSGDETHAWTLVGGELTHPQSYSRRIDDFDPKLRDFVIWSSMEPSPLLRLFIGDTGRGIHASLEAKKASMAGALFNEYTRDPTALIHGKAILTALDHHAAHNVAIQPE